MSENKTKQTAKLSFMMFLQFFVWGSWFVTLFLVLAGNGLETSVAEAYSTAPIAAIIAPLFLGLIADRLFSSEKVMGALMLLGGGLMLLVPGAISSANSSLVFWLLLAHMLCYMPTLGLGNTIAFTHLPRDVFPRIRVWGTIGWIAAGLVTGFLGWSGSLNVFWMAGISSLALGLFCFSLPHTPPPAAGQAVNLRSLFMVDAFKLMTIPAFAVFIACSTLICIPLAYYYSNASGYLANMGFEQAASAMSIGQMSEIFFMLLIPFFFRKLGVKWMIMIGMLAWVLRYFLFAIAASDQSVWMLFAGIALHGICYDFFFVTGFMYADRVAPKELKGQVQSMLVFFTQGVGMLIGFKVAGAQLAPLKENIGLLGEEITAGRPEGKIGFFEQFTQMFSVSMPESVDPDLRSSTASLWQDYWTLPAYMAAAIALVFFLGFWDRSKEGRAE